MAPEVGGGRGGGGDKGGELLSLKDQNFNVYIVQSSKIGLSKRAFHVEDLVRVQM